MTMLGKESLSAELFDFIRQPNFPCVDAKSALGREQIVSLEASIDPQGEQVSDLVAFNAQDVEAFLSNGRVMAVLAAVCSPSLPGPTIGLDSFPPHCFQSFHGRPQAKQVR